MTDHKKLIAEANEYVDAIQGGESENWMNAVKTIDTLSAALAESDADNTELRKEIASLKAAIERGFRLVDANQWTGIQTRAALSAHPSKEEQ